MKLNSSNAYNVAVQVRIFHFFPRQGKVVRSRERRTISLASVQRKLLVLAIFSMDRAKIMKPGDLARMKRTTIVTSLHPFSIACCHGQKKRECGLKKKTADII